MYDGLFNKNHRLKPKRFSSSAARDQQIGDIFPVGSLGPGWSSNDDVELLLQKRWF